MKCYSDNLVCHFLLQYHHFVVIVDLVMIWSAAGAAVTQVTRPHLTVAVTSATTVQRQTTATPAKPGVRVPADYDYVDLPRQMGQTRLESESVTLPHVDIVGHNPPTSNMDWAALSAGLNGIQGEQYEWLRERVKILQHHGMMDQVDALQDKYPMVNLTLLYDFYSNGGRVYEADNILYYHHNGSYHLSSGYREAGGLGHNETSILVKGQETEDGHFFNGTWYDGEREMEDGYFYNGSYYGDEVELPERDDGYSNNGTTFHTEEEQVKNEGLMWLQLHHPRWRDGVVNNIDNSKSLPLNQNQMQQQPSLSKLGGHPLPQKSGQKQQLQQKQSYQVPALQQEHQKLAIIPRQPVNRSSAVEIPPQNRGAVGRNDLHLGQTVLSVVDADTGSPGRAAMMGNEKLPEQVNSQASSSLSATESWAIAVAVVLGLAVVLAPIACLLLKYRHEKRIKKRTFLRRPQHGSVDKGIMDALVMTELGERAQSRVRHFELGEGGKRQKPTGSKTGFTHKSKHMYKYELQTPPIS